MKPTHLSTPRTLDQCHFTYPAPIEHYRAAGPSPWLAVVAVAAAFIGALVLTVLPL
jgi:hypothetical protein